MTEEQIQAEAFRRWPQKKNGTIGKGRRKAFIAGAQFAATQPQVGYSPEQVRQAFTKLAEKRQTNWSAETEFTFLMDQLATSRLATTPSEQKGAGEAAELCKQMHAEAPATESWIDFNVRFAMEYARRQLAAATSPKEPVTAPSDRVAEALRELKRYVYSWKVPGYLNAVALIDHALSGDTHQPQSGERVDEALRDKLKAEYEKLHAQEKQLNSTSRYTNALRLAAEYFGFNAENWTGDTRREEDRGTDLRELATRFAKEIIVSRNGNADERLVDVMLRFHAAALSPTK